MLELQFFLYYYSKKCNFNYHEDDSMETDDSYDQYMFLTNLEKEKNENKKTMSSLKILIHKSEEEKNELKKDIARLVCAFLS